MIHRALILDFDGLMVDSEMAEYVSWQELYHGKGASLALEDWLGAVGYVNGFDPRAHLESLTGQAFDWERLDARRAARARELLAGLPALPGVAALIERGARAGYRLGVASNSTASWVLPGLERLGLRGRFGAIRTRDCVARPKPHPELYLRTLEDLDADPAASFAFEDSEPGVAAARAAGLYVVAVPNSLTRHQDLSQADLRLARLDEFRLPDETLPQS